MIDVIVRVERSQRQPGKHRGEGSVAQTFPEHPAPLDVVVTVKVATANCIRGVLKLPEEESDCDGACAQVNAAHRSLGSEYRGKLRGLHLSR